MNTEKQNKGAYMLMIILIVLGSYFLLEVVGI
jgi:hypothetical protein